MFLFFAAYILSCCYISSDMNLQAMWHTVFTRVICALFSRSAAEKSGCVKYADFFLWRSCSGFYSSVIENTASFINILL
jgi:hypothetical protein